MLTNTQSIEYMNEMNDKIINLDVGDSLVLPAIDKRNNSYFIAKSMQKT